MHIKAGDTVAIIAGGDQFTVDKKGVKTRKTGRVIKVYPKTNRVLVEGVNIVKKHERPKQANDKGGIVEIEAPINATNVAVVDPKTNEPTRTYIKVVDGKKVRFSRKSDTQIDK